MESVQAAADAFTLVRRLTGDCKDTVEDLLMFYFEQEAAEEVEAGDPAEQVDITPLEATFDEMAFPAYGDETYATRITMVAQYGEVTIPVNVDSIAIRVGNAVASFTYTYNLFTIINPPEHEQELAAILEQRLRAN